MKEILRVFWMVVFGLIAGVTLFVAVFAAIVTLALFGIGYFVGGLAIAMRE